MLLIEHLLFCIWTCITLIVNITAIRHCRVQSPTQLSLPPNFATPGFRGTPVPTPGLQIWNLPAVVSRPQLHQSWCCITNRHFGVPFLIMNSTLVWVRPSKPRHPVSQWMVLQIPAIQTGTPDSFRPCHSTCSIFKVLLGHPLQCEPEFSGWANPTAHWQGSETLLHWRRSLCRMSFRVIHFRAVTQL